MPKYVILLKSRCGGGRTTVGPFNFQAEAEKLMKEKGFKKFKKIFDGSWFRGSTLAAVIPLMPPSAI